MRVGFSGSRKRHNKEIEAKVKEIISKLSSDNDIICHGGCPKGADYFAKKYAELYGIPQKIFYPEKSEARYYLKRNIELAKYIDILYAFPKSKKTGELSLKGIVVRGGTEHTIRNAINLGKKVIIL